MPTVIGSTKEEFDRKFMEQRGQVAPVDEPEIKESTSLVKEKGTKYELPSGYIDIQHEDTKYSPRKQSIVDFVVDENKRGEGIGAKLLKHALSKHDDLGGQASSTASVKVLYNHGFRHPELSKGTFQHHEDKRKQDSSVYMAYRDDKGKKYIGK